MSDYCAWLPEVRRIAEQAGHAILQVYAGEISIQRKADDTPLTQADLAAHQVIAAGLARLTPSLPQLSEESDAIPYHIRRSWQRYWLVDPLDGTREFIKRNGEFSVNIALIDQGKPVLGVVYAPVPQLMYHACAGQGAYRQQHGGDVQRISARPLDAARVVVAGSRSHSSPRMQAFLARVAGNLSTPGLISLGSSLKICLVAEGQADLYPRLGLTSEWDTAAAQCVLEQAGGALVDHQGEALAYNTKDSLLNPEFFACGSTPHPWSRYLE